MPYFIKDLKKKRMRDTFISEAIERATSGVTSRVRPPKFDEIFQTQSNVVPTAAIHNLFGIQKREIRRLDDLPTGFNIQSQQSGYNVIDSLKDKLKDRYIDIEVKDDGTEATFRGIKTTK